MEEFKQICFKRLQEYLPLFKEYGIHVDLVVINTPSEDPSKIIKNGANYTVYMNYARIRMFVEQFVDTTIMAIVLPLLHLETSRLIIRRYTPDDFEDVFEITSNPNVALADGYKPDESLDSFRNVYKYFLSNPTMYAFELKDTHKVIGGISLKNDTKRQVTCYEVGYNINQSYWRKGYAYEGVFEVMKYLFTRLNLSMMSVSHFDDNEASKNLILKLGFQYEGFFRNTFYHTAFGIKDLQIYSITNEEFMKTIQK